MNTLKTLILLAVVGGAIPTATTPGFAQEQPPPGGESSDGDGSGEPGDDEPGTDDPGTDDPGGDGPDDPDDSNPAPVADCPVKKTANFPVGGGNSLCLFQTEACGTAPRVRATGFHACDKLECSCTGNTCYGQNTTHSDSGPPPVLPLNFMANAKKLPWVVPIANTLVQSAAGQITTFGVGDYKVKYLKVLRLQSPAGQQYFALFKVFRGDDAADLGDDYEETDGYVGVRVSALSAPPAGGYLDLDSASVTHFQKLQKFVNDDGTPGYVREAGAKLPIASGPATAETWFHLYGSVL